MAVTLSQLWKLPCIYICENNMYGMGTSLKRAMSLQNVAQKSCAYEMASEFVDGMDVLKMRQATQRAVKRAREEHLPTLLEARTYRYMGHSMSDPGNYRTRAEIEKYQERDPIKLFIDSLKTNNVIGDDDLAQIEAQVKEDVAQSVRFAEESPLPDESELYTDIYANPL
jgi:pyruvate dehydrogenase E1 component alpha subunit